MKLGLRAALSVYLGFVIYTLLVFFFGQSGVLAYRDVEDHAVALKHNIVELEHIRADLVHRRDVLLHDPDELALLGRTLGYMADEEVRIVLSSRRPMGIGYIIGRMVRQFQTDARDHSILRVIAVVAALAAFVVATILIGRTHGSPARK